MVTWPGSPSRPRSSYGTSQLQPDAHRAVGPPVGVVGRPAVGAVERRRDRRAGGLLGLAAGVLQRRGSSGVARRRLDVALDTDVATAGDDQHHEHHEDGREDHDLDGHRPAFVAHAEPSGHGAPRPGTPRSGPRPSGSPSGHPDGRISCALPVTVTRTRSFPTRVTVMCDVLEDAVADRRRRTGGRLQRPGPRPVDPRNAGGFARYRTRRLVAEPDERELHRDEDDQHQQRHVEHQLHAADADVVPAATTRSGTASSEADAVGLGLDLAADDDADAEREDSDQHGA